VRGKKKIEKCFGPFGNTLNFVKENKKNRENVLDHYQLELLRVGQLSVGTGGSLVLRSQIGRTSLGVLPWYQIEGQ